MLVSQPQKKVSTFFGELKSGKLTKYKKKIKNAYRTGRSRHFFAWRLVINFWPVIGFNNRLKITKSFLNGKKIYETIV